MKKNLNTSPYRNRMQKLSDAIYKMSLPKLLVLLLKIAVCMLVVRNHSIGTIDNDPAEHLVAPIYSIPYEDGRNGSQSPVKY